ncbi:hypothetical protein ABW20_dc0109497 [Dactylellina cionopaga]|nr:hypothetical protein ABW20_dc0109497 [Dactylellina cionopaga]
MSQQLQAGTEDPASEFRGKNTMYFIEKTPYSPRGSKCRICSDRIEIESYRLAANHGPYGSGVHDGTECFENKAPVLDIDFIDRVIPLTRESLEFRGLKTINYEYFLEAGLGLLISEWKIQRGRWMDIRDGKEPDVRDDNDPWIKLRHYAGSAHHEIKMPANMNPRHYFTLAVTLAPWESDGPDDTNEWNLYTEFLKEDTADCLNNRHSLSELIESWDDCVDAVHADEDKLDEYQKGIRNKLGEKGIRAINRLAVVLGVDIQGLWGM